VLLLEGTSIVFPFNLILEMRATYSLYFNYATKIFLFTDTKNIFADCRVKRKKMRNSNNSIAQIS